MGRGSAWIALGVVEEGGGGALPELTATSRSEEGAGRGTVDPGVVNVVIEIRGCDCACLAPLGALSVPTEVDWVQEDQYFGKKKVEKSLTIEPCFILDCTFAMDIKF